ncbi:MAG: hypothetical protein HN919_02500 [Verrucomicrobia bacterium]|jgi:hypothetical protein|nr:hypothetical protein [Verrucomicrobiota bacterium]
MVKAFKELKPVVGKQLEGDLEAIADPDERAAHFYKVFCDKRVSKGRFAQELAQVLDEAGLPADVVPQYIRDAMQFLGVTAGGDADEQAGGTQEPDPVAETD